MTHTVITRQMGSLPSQSSTRQDTWFLKTNPLLASSYTGSLSMEGFEKSNLFKYLRQHAIKKIKLKIFQSY